MGIQNIGLIVESPATEVDQSIAEGFSSRGINVIPLSVDGEWRDDLDAYVISGPFYPLSHILPKIEQLARHNHPKIVVWLTEQRASAELPNWIIRAVGTGLRLICRSTERVLGKNISPKINQYVNKVYAGTRYRLPSEIRWLKDHDYLKLLAVLTPSHQQFYSEKIGVPAEVIPYGYNPAFGRDLHLERDVDVVFLGSLRDRRRSEIMQRFESDFTKLEIKFVIHDGSPERGLVFGEERTRLINRTKILLSIMRQPWDDLVFRMLLGTPNGAMVVSEPVQDQYPFQSGVHFASAEIDRIPETVKYYLEHEEERQRIVQSAQDVIFNQMTGSMMTGKMLAALDENLTEE